MTEKRFRIDDDGIVTDMLDLSMYIDNEDCCEKLKELYEENEQLKTQLQNTSDQRDEFYRGARENANNVGQLEKENEELKKQLEREETDKKRLMSLLMKYKSYSFDEIVEDILDEPYYDNWWEDGFYESCWDEYLKEKGFNGCDEECVKNDLQ